MSLTTTAFTVQRKFILNKKDPFIVEAIPSSGKLNMFIGLAPGASQKAIWKATGSSSSSARIAVKTSDAQFHVGAYYYIIFSSAEGKVDFKYSINQQRTVAQLQPGVVYKDLYWTAEERVKFYYLQVPRSKVNLRTNITVRGLTPDFYPTILVSKNVLQKEIDSPANAGNSLVFPNLQSYNFSFGDNFTQVANI